MEWSNEDCLQLIDLYEQYSVLWEAKHPFHYSKNKKVDAWDQIADKINRDVNVVKQKMTSLLGSFRAQKSKGKKTIGTGKARREIYISKWFAFERMHFLLDKDEPKDTLDTNNEQFNENTPSPVETNQETTEALLESQETEDVVVSGDAELSVTERIAVPQPKKARKNKEKEDPRLKDAFRMLKDTHAKYTASQNELPDRFAIYGQHVAGKLRTYTKKTQAMVEHSINNILFDADMGNIDSMYVPQAKNFSSTNSTPAPSPALSYPGSSPIYSPETNPNISTETPSTSNFLGSNSGSTEVDQFDSSFCLQNLI